MLTDEHTQKLGLLNQLLIAGAQDQYVPSAYDKEFLQRKFPNIYGAPERTIPETRQLDLFGGHEKWKVESTPNNQDMSIAGAPRYIKGSAPPNVIWKAPHLDSPVIDNWRDRGYTPGMEIPKPGGPQLPDFVHNPDGGEQLAQNYQPYDAAMDDLRIRRKEGKVNDQQWIKELQIINRTLYPNRV